MSLADQKAVSQLSLPIPVGAETSVERSVWLLSANKSDADVLRYRSAAGSVRPFLLLDLETGAEAVRSDDILLVKTADRPGLDVLVDPTTVVSMNAKGLARQIVASFRKLPGHSGRGRSLDLGLVKFGSNTLRRDRKGWTRSEIESTIDVLLVREMAESPELTDRLCAELLDCAGLESLSPLRPIALRMRANALASRGDQATATRLYLAAAAAFADRGMAFQSGTSRMLGITLGHAAQQLELWSDVGASAPPAPRIGFHMRRFSGMKLPLTTWGFPGGRGAGGPLRHVNVGSVNLEPSMIASWLAKDSSPSAEVSMTVADTVSLNGMRQVDFVVDSELATLSGLAGRAEPRRRDAYRFIVQSGSCRIEPRFADTSFGRPAPFLVSAPVQGRHVIELQVLTRDTPPTSIDFVLPPF